MRERYNCPSCNTPHTTKLEQPNILVCVKCGSKIWESDHLANIQDITMPHDWSFIKIGTNGTYKDHYFTIIGKVRLQLRNDYKTFWCATYNNGKCLYISESFASLAVFQPNWRDYTGDISKLRAGNTIKLGADSRITGEFVEKCEGLAFQGEIGPWKNYIPGFFVIQASNNSGHTALYFISADNTCTYSVGEKTDSKKLKLENIVDYHDWR